MKHPCPKCGSPAAVVRSARGKEKARIVAVICDACGVSETAEERVRWSEWKMERQR